MNDDRLGELLGSLRSERMGRIGDARARLRLEGEWADIQERRARPFLRRLAPIVISVSFLALVAFATLHAPGDSPLYGARIAVEDLAANVYADPQDRVQYLLALYDQRQAEAARLESIGSAASSGARRIEQRTLATLQALLPHAPEEEAPSPAPSPVPSAPAVLPSPSATPEPTASPAVPRTPTSTPRPTTPPTSAPPATTRPTPVPTPKPTATPLATPTRDLTIPVTLNGTIVDAGGAPAGEVCVSVTAPECSTRTTSAGIYRLVISAKYGQTVAVYAWIADATGKILYKGTASVVARSTVIQVPTIQLHPY